jgi:DNA-binding SARP family transcriptional activator
VGIGPLKQRTVLAVLLAASGAVVSLDRLLDELWSGRPPCSAEANVRSYAAGLRRALPPTERHRLATVDRGYRLAVGADEVDLAAFETLAREGRRAIERRDSVAADRALIRALALWRGRPFENAQSCPEVDGVARRLEELRMTAQEDLFEAQLALGGHWHVAPLVRRWVQANPLRERGWGQLALALYRTGNPSAALAACDEVRSVLAEELGLEPGPDLQRLRRAILKHDGSLVAGAGAVAEVRPVRPPVPRQLPPAPFVFVGRRVELDMLARIMGRPRSAGVPGIVAVHGPAGIGKSALATVAAHRLADRYPDGQLFVDLGGTAARDTTRLFGTLLHALGEPTDDDADPVETVLRWRSVLASRRILIVLDNAQSETQIEPILPANSGCGVIVTSRRVCGGLPVACRVVLDSLAETDALEMLERYAGVRSLRDQVAALRDVVRQCSGLPLALRRAASRLALRSVSSSNR